MSQALRSHPCVIVRESWLPKCISVHACLARAFLFSLSRDLPGSFCLCEGSGLQTIPLDILALACTPAGSPWPAAYCWAGPLQGRPALGKAGFPGGARIPLIMPPATCPSPAGARRRARAPATDRPEAHFPHPGRGGRQTSEGGGWGRALGTTMAQHRRRPRLRLPGLEGTAR